MTTISNQTDYRSYNADKILALHQLRVNVKSLTAEARFIRQETKRAGRAYRNQLALHRRTRLREEARLAHLALAFVRGKAYRVVENQASVPISERRLVNKINRYLDVKETTVREWLRA